MQFKMQLKNSVAPAAALALSAALALGAASPALAADVIVDVPAPPVVDVAPAFTWSGFYGGVHAGYAFSGNDDDVLFDVTGFLTPGGVPGTNTFRDNFSDDAGFVGGQVGVLYEVAPFGAGSLVLGADASYVFDGSDDRSTIINAGLLGLPAAQGNVIQFDSDVGIDVIGHVRGQVGVSSGRVMGYVAAGAAFSDADFEGTVRDLTVAGAPVIATVTADGGTAGYTVGGGANFAFNDNAFVNLDYRYTDLGDQTITTAFTNGAATAVERDLDFHQVRAGFNFKFN